VARLGAAALFALALCAPSPAQDGAARDVNEIGKETGVRPPLINTRPLQDVAAEAKRLFDEGRLGADARLDVSVRAGLNDDGSLKYDTTVFTWTNGSDAPVASLAQRLVLALGESKLLHMLEGAKEVTLRLRLDETNARFDASAELPSAERARQLAGGYSAILKLATLSKQGTSEGELYKSLKFESDDRRFAFTFGMTREALRGIIEEMLARKAARANG
jgi:hypothetical protein